MNRQANKIKIGIIGGAGYAGGEVLRLLLRHPDVSINLVHSRSHEDQFVYQVHRDLYGETNLMFNSQPDVRDLNVLFLCLGHGESKLFLEQHSIPDRIKIIDLSQDFRLQTSSLWQNRTFIYGLPEVNRKEIQHASNIANPGCFATAIQLSVLPLAYQGLLNDVHVTGITGSTGAGQGFQTTSHFSWRENNIQAYKSLNHQHLGEVKETINKLQHGFQNLYFIPWRGDFTRGIYLSAYIHCSVSIEKITECYKTYYSSHPFTVLSKQVVDLKQVVNTNKCLISLEKVKDQLIIHTAIDNLLKGAAGQAVQNMNLMCGLAEDSGLNLKANAF